MALGGSKGGAPSQALLVLCGRYCVRLEWNNLILQHEPDRAFAVARYGSNGCGRLDGCLRAKIQKELGILALSAKQRVVDSLGPRGSSIRTDLSPNMFGRH
jgi:hypothetical protein